MSIKGSAEAAIKDLARSAIDARMSLDSIFMSTENNIRELYDTDEMASLTASIEEVGGILTPLHVVEVSPTPATDEKSYVVLSGYRRYQALAELGEGDPGFLEDIPVRIMQPKTAGGIKLSQLIENIQRSDLTPLEKAYGFKEAMSDEVASLSQKDVARLLGISETAVSTHLRLLELPDSIRDMLDAHEISFSHARTIMYQVPQDQWVAAAKIASTCTFGDFTRRVESRYGAKDDNEETVDGKPDTTVQRAASMIRANKLKTMYLPFFIQQAKEAKTEEEKVTWDTRLDTIRWMMQDSTTKLSEIVKPHEEKLAAEEEANAAGKKTEQAQKKYLRIQMSSLLRLRKVIPNDGETKATLAEDLGSIRNGVITAIAKEDFFAAHGFTLESVDTFMDNLAKEWAESLKKKEDDRVKRTQKKTEKEAADKITADKTAGDSPGGEAAAE